MLQGAVGVGTRVGHGEEARGGVLDQEVLVVELRSVDRLAPGSVKPLEVAALQHELRDDPVEDRPLVREPLRVLTRRDGSKIGDSSWNNLVKELQVDHTIVFIVCRDSELKLCSLRLLLLLWRLALRHWGLWLLELPLRLLLLELLLLLGWLSELLLLLLLLLSKEAPDLVIGEALLSQCVDILLCLTQQHCWQEKEN